MHATLVRPYTLAGVVVEPRRSASAFRWLAPAAFVLLFAAGVAVPVAIGLLRVATTVFVPAVAPVDTLPIFVDNVPLAFTIRGGVAPWQATRSDLVSDVRLWRRMHVEDWDTVPEPVRSEALPALVNQYRDILLQPQTWDRMSASDWDAVPQPIRMFAFRRMVAYWAGYYDVGEEYGIEPWRASSTLAAIAMQESWFDHRATTINRQGNRDIGVAQASDFARIRMRELFVQGSVDVLMSDEDYLNPWKATRFLALWMKVLLAESGGDLDLATRAYHRGTARAGDELGTTYLSLVERRLRRFILNRDAPPAWSALARQVARLEEGQREGAASAYDTEGAAPAYKKRAGPKAGPD
jgi:hypothetical protein